MSFTAVARGAILDDVTESLSPRDPSEPFPRASDPSIAETSDVVAVASVKRYALPDRSLPPLAPREASVDRWVWLGVMVAILALYAFTLLSFWAPADGGIDQNAYLVGGRQLAHHGTTRFDPATPYGFVGPMFVVPEKGAEGFYPKYPFGLPLLFAISIWIGGASHAAIWPFAVSPVCAIAAVAGMFYLARMIGGSFAGILCAIALATCEVMWSLANVSNSHASCLAFVVWGFVALFKWWSAPAETKAQQVRSFGLGLLAGFLIGFACAIRYTEGLLILPIALVVMFKIRWSNWRSYLRNAAPVIGWLIPLIALAIFNRVTIGAWTGYDSSNESELGKAFTIDKFIDTWEQVVRTFHDQGLFFLLPVCVMGLMMLVVRNWKVGVVVLAWLIPGTALYTSYYWSPDRGVAYARFFLTFFPALLLGLAACARYFDAGLTAAKPAAMKLSLGVLVFIASGVATWRVVQASDGPGGDMGSSLSAQFRSRATLANVGDVLLRNVKPNSILFADEGRGPNAPCHYLQFIGDWELYGVDAFANRGLRGAMRMGPGGANGDNPSPMQKKRIEKAQAIYKGKGDKELLAEQRRISDAALAAGRHIYLLGSRSSVDSAEDRYFPEKDYDIIRVQTWKDMPEPRDIGPDSVDRNIPRARSGNGMFGGGGPGGGGPGGGGPGGGGPGGGGRNNRGGGGGGGGFFGGGGTNTQWVLVEFRAKKETATTRPATKPTTQATTQPAK